MTTGMLNPLRCICAGLVAATLNAFTATAEVSVQVTYLRVEEELPPTLSNLDPPPGDLGIAGARIGLEDNATTGRFLGHEYTLTVVEVPIGANPLAAAGTALADTPYMILDAPPAIQLAIADLPEARHAVLFNVSAPHGFLRDSECRANLLHTTPSSAMRTDALAQFLVKRRWTRLALIVGPHQVDRDYAAALHASLGKFGLEPVSEQQWRFDADMRRNAAQEVPLFTQDLRDHDVLLIADEARDFGRYIAYNTWDPRPVAGSEGLSPVAWSPVVEQWGAAQLQLRFGKGSGRKMLPRDYAAWAAMRVLGEAATRTNSGEARTLRAFILGPDFELAGFKGRPLSFRNWNGQLRQPIPLVHPRALVAMAPLEGFLHPESELDTLGRDRPETNCGEFGE